jgi:hypothetical protein
MPWLVSKPGCLWVAGSLLIAASFTDWLPAAGQAKQVKVSAHAATCITVPGALLQRPEAGVWRSVKPGDALADGTLLVALPKAELQSANKAVAVNLLADIGQRGRYPVLESAVRLHRDDKIDLAVTLDRGIMTLTNLKKQGTAKVRVTVAGQTWELVLHEPGTRVGLEFFGRHPPGAPKILEGKIEAPTAHVLVLVLQGHAFLHTGKHGHRLQAPPGAALLQWNNIEDHTTVEHLDKLPDAVSRELDDKEAKLFQEICHCTRSLAERPLDKVRLEWSKSDEKVDRLVGVTVLGATDQLPALLDALANPKHADARDHAVLVLRHWMGRGPGQVEKLYATMTDNKRYSRVHARTILQLLFGFSPDDRQRPETYELLIALLRHPQLPVRELARWHLVRLAPAGKGIAYDAGGPESERQKGYEQWRALIPDGRLPPAPPLAPDRK